MVKGDKIEVVYNKCVRILQPNLHTQTHSYNYHHTH
jgi:hypothetical protein